MTFNDFITKYKPDLADCIASYAKERMSERSDLLFYEDSLKKLSEMTTSGKMLRGLFVLLLASFHDKSLLADPRVIRVAAAMEYIQSALLIHDDIIDNDRTRRGKKTIFAQYAETATSDNLPYPDTYGKSLAICCGDIAIFLAFDLISDISDSISIQKKITSLMAKEIHLVAIGEMIDVDMATRKGEPPVPAIMQMYTYKTSRYSFSLPFVLGATMGGGDGNVIADLERLGENIGVLFQIHDDWLGLYGDEETTGKPVGSDLREQKKTIYRSMLYRDITETQRKELESMPESAILALMKHHDIEERIEEVKHCYRQESLDIIDTLPYNDDQKDTLREIVRLVTQRNR